MSGSGGTGLSTEWFIGDDGISIRWERLATTLVGSVLVAWGVGFATVVDAIFPLVISGVKWLASFGSGLLKESFGIIIAMGTTAWSLALGSVEGLTGLWVPVVMLAVVLAYFALIQRGDD